MTPALTPRPATTALRVEPPFAALLPTDLTLASPAELARTIGELELACLENPKSASLWTCLGIAYAVNYDVVKSLDALETATEVEPDHFWAQLKHGELQYRLRVLMHAEATTLRAEALAEDPWQLSLARKQLKEIRKLTGGKSLQPDLVKPRRTVPALLFSAAFLVVGLAWMWP
jgi:cytochrome c-type biogenesis protein CcmH/NrfG